MISIGKIIDGISDNLDRVKTIGIIILLVLFGISIFNNGCSRSEFETMVEKVTGLNVQNDILQKDIKLRDSILLAKQDSITLLEQKIILSKKRERELESDNDKLRKDYDDIASDLIEISSDSSYSFLDHVAYPYKGVKKYPFNEVQVKGIHRTYLEHQGLLALNDNLNEQKDELYHQIYLKDSLATETYSTMSLMKSNREDLEEVIVNKDEEIKINEKALKKAKRRKIFGMIGVGTASLIIGFLAGG